MADIKVRGFVNKPASRDGSKGKFATFDLAEGVKQKDGTYKSTYYRVTNFHSETPPEDGSRVEVSGWFKANKVERDGKTFMNLDIVAESLTELEGAKTSAPAPATSDAGDEFDF